MHRLSQVLAIAALCSMIAVSALAYNRENGFESYERLSRRVPRPSYGSEESVVPRYRFAYRTRAGRGYGGGQYEDNVSSEFGHAEKRDGDRTDGKYYVQLPDGRLQIVRYYVDGDSGYVAHVSYGGEAGADDGISYERN